jgi:hypothetical protein
MTMQNDAQVTTVVQQIDAQGPVVVDRITTQFSDVACNAENARKLVEGLHGGTSVTLSADGKTATFTATGGPLGYGEAYITLALAAEALRNAGVTGCATPDQWQAVLLGGPLAAAGTSSTSTTRIASASSSSQFPGILTLRSQGQGWGQIAQTTNVKLGQVMSSARSSLNLSSSSDSSLAPTGRSSSDFNRSSTTNPSSSSSSSISPSSTPSRDSSIPKPDKDQDKSSTGKDDDNSSIAPKSSSSSTSSSSTSPNQPRPDRQN